jgi:hypothetical protein
MVNSQKEMQSRLTQELPIFPNEDFDLVFGKLGWPLATNSNVPEEFLRMILAGGTTCFLGNRSIDNVYRKYFKEKAFEVHDGQRLDYKVAKFANERIAFFNAASSFVSDGGSGPLGRTIAIWTLVRFKFSLKILLTCAQRGGLFETATLSRSILEQIAWSFRIRVLDDSDEIASIAATKSIGELKTVFLPAGQLYGWLSNHAHWAYEAHSKVYVRETKWHRHVLADSTLKAKSLIVVLIICELAIKMWKTITEETLGPDAWEPFFILHNADTVDAPQLVAEICALAGQEDSGDDDFSLLLSFLNSKK